MLIIGAGLSGLIAATQFPTATVIEANPRVVGHKALLRFRSEAVSNLTGVPFKRVTVRKSIWYNRTHCAPDILLANKYSLKTNGKVLNRSVWNTETVDRFIAPEDFIQQLTDMCSNRILFNTKWADDPHTRPNPDTPIISTIPMGVMNSILGNSNVLNDERFSFQRIIVDRYRIEGADLYQTIYYPDSRTSVYRASISGDLLIVERVENKAISDAHLKADFLDVLLSFGLEDAEVSVVEQNHVQKYGKIAPIDDVKRRKFIYDTTIKSNIYSLGRFAVWKNILLDDVVKDIAVIKRLIQQGQYAAALQNQKG